MWRWQMSKKKNKEGAKNISKDLSEQKKKIK